ncbi:hypothetical protein OBBRIDRAFT_806237 [Obba rivulosa]|uniref:Uncharacterized protein n=1 Tax=Obba rivulosa TaxID=1052685 RepID=A0A8E2DHK3_9APHY|nr:hypothetical protein OBBRIDRAFT_806237 [Obba rivulosa]
MARTSSIPAANSLYPTMRRIEYPSPFGFIKNDFVPLVEQRMRKFVSIITEKPRWHEKAFDDGIVGRWRKEFKEQDDQLVKGLSDTVNVSECIQQWPRDRVTDVQLDWVFDCLRWAARERDPATGIEVTGINKIYRSNELIAAQLKSQFIDAVLDLVHPSLYCFRIGKSLIKDPNTGKLSVLSNNESFDGRTDLPDTYFCISQQHQWLPTNFCVSQDGNVRPLAYINNMHSTKYAALYKSISSERVLSDLLSPNPPLAIAPDPYRWYEDIEHPEPDWGAYYADDKEDEYHEDYEDWGRNKSGQGYPNHPPSLRGRDTQVIVKLANIVLTPDKPAYAGGLWYVEGMFNERIIATGIYYYASENISESRLGFRAMVVYDIDGDGGPLSQPLGSVVTREDLCLVFPNIYQHRVAPFELADLTKPGVRKTLYFLLVDPTHHILSTTEVPPQQRPWCDETANFPGMQNLPVELFNMVRDEVIDGTITLDEAKEERKKLMKERADFVISLCWLEPVFVVYVSFLLN